MVDASKARLLERAAKLEALTTSDNVNEAALAAAKLQELLFKHNLTMGDINSATGPIYGSVLVDIRRGGLPGIVEWKIQLLNTIAKVNFCHMVWEHEVGFKKDGNARLIGEAHSITVVRHMYAYLMISVVRLAERDWTRVTDWRERSLGKVRWVEGFYLGALHGIQLRLSQQRKEDEAQEGGSALVLVKNEELNKAANSLYPEGTRHMPVLKETNQQAYMAGRQASAEIGLGTEVRGQNKPEEMLALAGSL